MLGQTGNLWGVPRFASYRPQKPVSSDESESRERFLSGSSPEGSAYRCGLPTDSVLVILENLQV